MKIALEISYFGKEFHGWQVQKGRRTVQGEIDSASEKLFGKHIDVTGCSRTDSGVSANFYLMTLSDESDFCHFPVEKVPDALNFYLPNDISCHSAYFVEESFHPRYDVKYKEYEYLIWNGKERNVFLYDRSLFYPKKLDIDLMNKACEKFLGKHDFTAFSSSGSDVKDKERTIKYFSVRKENDLVKINVAADGFLYNMVRILVGTLIEVSEGKINVSEIENILESKERKKAGHTAVPEGLFLNKVVY